MINYYHCTSDNAEQWRLILTFVGVSLKLLYTIVILGKARSFS